MFNLTFSALLFVALAAHPAEVSDGAAELSVLNVQSKEMIRQLCSVLRAPGRRGGITASAPVTAPYHRRFFATRQVKDREDAFLASLQRRASAAPPTAGTAADYRSAVPSVPRVDEARNSAAWTVDGLMGDDTPLPSTSGSTPTVDFPESLEKETDFYGLPPLGTEDAVLQSMLRDAAEPPTAPDEPPPLQEMDSDDVPNSSPTEPDLSHAEDTAGALEAKQAASPQPEEVFESLVKMAEEEEEAILSSVGIARDGRSDGRSDPGGVGNRERTTGFHFFEANAPEFGAARASLADRRLHHHAPGRGLDFDEDAVRSAERESVGEELPTSTRGR